VAADAIALKDLAIVAAFFVAFALAFLAHELAVAVTTGLDFSLFGFRPLHGLAVKLENSVVAWTESAYKSSERHVTKGLSGLIDELAVWLAIPLLLALGTKAALTYLWNHALRPVIHSIADPIKATAVEALAKATALAGTLELRFSEAEAYALARANGALETAKAFVNRRLEEEAATLRGDIGAAKAAAEKYADGAVSKLRAAEDTAIAGAVAVGVAAKVAGERAGREALAAAELSAGVAIAVEAAERAAELARLDAAGKAALEAVKSVAVNVNEELHTIEGAAGAVGVAALIAAIPAISTLVHAIASEAGLENADCRSKVKGICGTDPSSWERLLAGAALLALPLSLGELVRVARPLIEESAGLMKEFV
jgi:hypothetical protein